MSSVMPQKYTHLWLSSCLCFFWLQHSDCSPLQNKHLLWSFNKKNDQRIKAHLFLFFMFLFPSKSLCSSAACGLAISLSCGLWLRVCCLFLPEVQSQNLASSLELFGASGCHFLFSLPYHCFEFDFEFVSFSFLSSPYLTLHHHCFHFFFSF